MTVGLIFAFLGDVFLLGNGELFFMLGLGSFLLMQIFYIIVFLKNRGRRHYSQLLVAALLLIYVIVFQRIITANASAMSIPITIYAFAIGCMCFAAFSRSPNLPGYTMVVFGSILFVFSDSIIAIERFLQPFYLSGFIVMISYIAAQYFIVEGVILSKLNDQ